MNDAHTKILTDAARRGDRNSFRILYDRYSAGVYGLAYRMLGNRFDAEEVTQDVFVRVFNKIDTFEGRSLFRTWCLKIAVNTCYDRIRLKKRRTPYQVEWDEDTSSADTAGRDRSESFVLSSEVNRHVKSALQNMHEDLRITLILRDIEELPYDDISRILGCSMGTVASRIARARKHISTHLLSIGIDANYFDRA